MLWVERGNTLFGRDKDGNVFFYCKGDALSTYNTVEGKQDGLRDINLVSKGYRHLVCLDDFGNVWTAGCTEFGHLGREVSWTPGFGLVPSIINIIDITCSQHSTLCLNPDGIVYGFGVNVDGELGLGHNSTISLPIPLPLKNITSISGGTNHFLVLDTNGDVFTAGSNTYSQMGLTWFQRNFYKKNWVQIKGIPPIKRIFSAPASSFIETINNDILSFGSNTLGSIGHKSFRVISPTKIPFLTSPVINIICGGVDQSVIIEENGTIWLIGPGLLIYHIDENIQYDVGEEDVRINFKYIDFNSREEVISHSSLENLTLRNFRVIAYDISYNRNSWNRELFQEIQRVTVYVEITRLKNELEERFFFFDKSIQKKSARK